MERHLNTFSDLAVQRKLDRVRKSNPLVRINELVDWKPIETILSSVDRRKISYYGRDCYSPFAVFKALFLASIYNFSDRELEDHLNFNNLFMWFCGFSIESDIPDHSTLARWRERFENADIYEKCFIEVNNQLMNKGLEIKNAVIVDASLIDAKSRPRRKVIITVDPTGDDVLVEEEVDISEIKHINSTEVYIEESKDPDARWLKKGKKSYYGYKKHLSTNKEGFINGLITTPANVSDMSVFPDLIEIVKPNKKTRVYADKGYAYKKNREFLEKNQLKDGIMHKKPPKKELDNKLRQFNKLISKARFVVERTFGSIKQNLGGNRSKYIGLRKTHNFIMIRALAYNLIRATNYVFE
jgi:IS5 family transposase